jgi:hypothetical protein
VTVTETLNETKQEYVDGLRELADWLERNPDFIPPYQPLRVDVFTDDQMEFARKAKRLGGRREKLGSSSYFFVRRKFGPHYLDVNVGREQVCKRVVVGTREVLAQEARVEEIVEWECAPGILAQFPEADHGAD